MVIIGKLQPLKEKYRAIPLEDISKTTDKEWAEHWRVHGPGWRNPSPDNEKYLERAYGGSDMSSITDCSVFKSSVEFWAEKTGRIQNKISTEATRRGHLYEVVTAQKYAQKRHFEDGDDGFKVYSDGKVFLPDGSVEVVKDKNGEPVYPITPVHKSVSMLMYRDGRKNPDGSFKYPWALANCDAFVEENGEIGGLEIKTTANMKSVYTEWAKGIIPRYYLMQIVYYMAIMNVRWWDICCSWGQEYRDMAIIRFYRDYELEDWLFKKVEEFDSYVSADIEPPIDNCSGEFLTRYYYEMFGPSVNDRPMVELPEKFKSNIQAMLEIDKKLDELNSQIDQLKEKRWTEFSGIYSAMQDAGYGQLKLSEKEVVAIKVTTPKHRASFDSEALKQEHPDIYNKYLVEVFDVDAFKKAKENKVLKDKYKVLGTPNTDKDAYKKIKCELEVKTLK